MRTMTIGRFVVVVFAMMLHGFGPSVSGQSQQPTFRAGVDLVTIDVAVFDGDGRPVPGLGADAFEVKLNGKMQPVKLVSYLEARGEQEAATPGSAPARPEWDGRPGRQTISNAGVIDPTAPTGEDRVFVILVDNLSIPPTRGHRLFTAAQKFVQAVPAADPIAVVYTSDPSKPVGPTLDRDAVVTALSEIRGSAIDLASILVQGQVDVDNPEGAVGIHQALEIDYGVTQALKDAIAQACFGGDTTQVDSQVLDVLIAENQCAGRVFRDARVVAAQAKQIRTNQIGAIVGVITAMGQADGIRHLVILSDGIAVGRDVATLRPVAEAAARAGVQVSVLMEEHDMSMADEGRSNPGASVRAGATVSRMDTGAPQRRLEDQRMLMDGLQSATALVGGQFYRIVGDPAPFFERVRTASAAIYRLGLEPPPGLKPGEVIQVDAKVLRSGVNAFVNRHALLPESRPVEPAKPLSVDDRLTEIIGSGQQLGAVPLQVATLLRRAQGPAGQVELTVNLSVPPGADGPVRGPITAMFALAPAAGAGAGAEMPSGRRVFESAGPDGAFQGTFGLPATPGTYRLRVAVADGEGAFGAVESELDTTLPTIGPFGASDLLVAWVDAAGTPQLMALDPLPSSATGIRADLELYPPSAGVSLDTVQVELSVTKVGDADPTDERIVTPRDMNGVWRVATEFPVDMLDAGRYTLRARVIVGADVVGSTLATFTKR